MATPKLLEAACKGSHASQGGPDDDGSDENFVYGGPENTDGPAVQTGAWVADVTYERAASQLESANNLKQIGLGVHALNAGECSVDICAQNSPPASPEPVIHAGWGHFEIVLDGSSPANTRYANPSSFQIVSAGPSPLESDYSGAHALYQDVMIV